MCAWWQGPGPWCQARVGALSCCSGQALDQPSRCSESRRPVHPIASPSEGQELSQEPCCFECCYENGRTTTDGEDLMYRKLVPLICAMLLSTAAFGQGGGGSGGGAGGAAGGGAAGSAGAGGGGTGATGGSTTGTGVNPTAPGSQYTNPTTGLPYSPSNSNDPNNPNSPNNPLSNPRPPGSR